MSMYERCFEITPAPGFRRMIRKRAVKGNKDLQIDVERVLHDAMQVICKYVHGEDLNTMASVCKSWRYAVWLEKSKRHYIQCLNLRYYMINNQLADKFLDVNPCVSVFIHNNAEAEQHFLLPLLNGRSSEYLDDDLEEDLSDFNKHPPNKTIGLKVDQFCHTCSDDVILYSNLYGLFFPNNERHFRIRVVCVPLNNSAIRDPMGPYSNPELEAFDRSVNQQLVDELGLNEGEHPNSTILYLGGFNRFPILDFAIRNCIFDHCKRAQRNGKKVTLGSFFGTNIVQADENCRSVKCSSTRQLAVLLHISGRSIESWSTFIFPYALHEEIDRKLQQLNERVKRKQNCIGLISSARCIVPRCRHINHPSGDSSEMMNRLQRVFPDIPFMGSFVNYTYWKRPNMNLNDLDAPNDNDLTRKFCYDRYISIIVISHD